MYENRHARFTAVDPLLASGLSDIPQSFNRYVYCRNNPLSFVDKDGLFPTEIHNDILAKAFPGLTESQLQFLQWGASSVDTLAGTGYLFTLGGGNVLGHDGPTVDIPITLITSEAYKHAMIPEGKTKGEAVQLANAFITTNINNAINLQSEVDPGGNSISLMALFNFGKATHTMMDSISPAHRFFEEYSLKSTSLSIPFGNLQRSEIIARVGLDAIAAIIHSRKESKISETDKQKAVTLLRLNLLTGLGDNLFRQAVPESERQAIYDMVNESNGKFYYNDSGGVPTFWRTNGGGRFITILPVPSNQKEFDELGPPPPLVRP